MPQCQLKKNKNCLLIDENHIDVKCLPKKDILNLKQTPNLNSKVSLQDRMSYAIEINVHEIPLQKLENSRYLERFTRASILNTVPWQLPDVNSCSFCGAMRFAREPPSFCCSAGEISLSPQTMPEILLDLFTNPSSSIAMEFKKRARSYNNAFAFTSLGMKTEKNSYWAKNEIYALKVVGQVFHRFPDPITACTDAQHLQLYFYEVDSDANNSINSKILESKEFQPTIVQLILQALQSNPYAKFFKSLRSYNNLDEYTIVIRQDPNLDQRIYNVPTVSQIAAIWIESENMPENAMRDIRVYGDGGGTHKINYYYGCYDPLQYPLLFPNGEPGWHVGIERICQPSSKRQMQRCQGENHITPQNCSSAEDVITQELQVFQNIQRKRTTISCREYYCYKMQIRSNDASCLLHSGRLGQQYAIDMYIKLETSRLDYYRSEQQQSDARMESYQGLVDSLFVLCINDASQIGRRIILPTSFIGGPRDMRRRYMNAMALVQEFGKPDLFLTMTCNPKWDEITKQLLSLEQPHHDRPDLIARVFCAKLEELKNEIVRKKLFGDIAAYVYVVEYQKRGLPHAHWILIFKHHHKITSSYMYDYIISAEIPDENGSPLLLSRVAQHMVHGPCGSSNPNNACM